MITADITTAHSPLLCELHAYTDWSDGKLSLDELVDLYGEAGFDVLCVTDHVLCPDDRASTERSRRSRPLTS